MTTQVQSHAPALARPSLLRRALQADATTCAVSGPAVLIGAAPLAPLLGIPTAILAGAGIFFTLYAGWLFYSLRREPIPRRVAWVAVAVNGGLALECAVVLALGLLPLTAPGWWVMLSLAIAGALTAELVFWGLRK